MISIIYKNESNNYQTSSKSFSTKQCATKHQRAEAKVSALFVDPLVRGCDEPQAVPCEGRGTTIVVEE